MRSPQPPSTPPPATSSTMPIPASKKIVMHCLPPFPPPLLRSSSTPSLDSPPSVSSPSLSSPASLTMHSPASPESPDCTNDSKSPCLPNQSPPIARSFSSPSNSSTANASSEFFYRKLYVSRSTKLSRSGSCPHAFVGSFVESLLSGRVQGKPNHIEGYSLSVRVMGKLSFLSSPLVFPFCATYYEFRDDEAASRKSPYRATVELPSAVCIPPMGIISITIVNPSGTPVRMLMVKYDLSDMPYNSKTVQRFRAVTRDRKLVRYLIHLNFARTRVRPQTSPSKKFKGHHLFGSIKLCFPLCAEDDMDSLLESNDVLEPRFRYFPLSPGVDVSMPSPASASSSPLSCSGSPANALRFRNSPRNFPSPLASPLPPPLLGPSKLSLTSPSSSPDDD